MKTAHPFWSVTVFLILFNALQACNPSNKNGSAVRLSKGNDTSQISKLIARGNDLQSSDVDSLLPIKDELFYLGNATNNNKALLYSQIYYAEYCWMKAKHTLAMQTAIKALNDAERWQIKEALPELYGVIANLHKESRNYEQAFMAVDKGIQAARDNRDTAELISALGNKAMFTHGYYMFHDIPQNDHTSLGLQLAALKIAETSPKYESIRIRFYNNIAQTYKERKDYTKALYYGDKAVALANKYNRPRSLTYSYCWLGEAYFYMGQRDKGLQYLNKALTISKEIREPYRTMEINASINDAYTFAGDYKEAMAAYKKYVHLRDSLAVVNNSKQLSELQIRFENEQKDKQIAILNKLNRLNRQYVWVVAISALIFLGLFILILVQYFIIRKSNKQVNEKNDGLKDALLKIAFIQSHEIRKPLSTLLGIMNLIKEDKYIADREILMMAERSALDLDTKICQIISEVEKR
ncbi:tetratricopeptide repeat protein [Mucilaginibacter sp.]|uniref:tetratricopeptide repeat protein n=1 Tax=Mucilaginibacter sp. TaxID=1882438 RepID=UPI0035BBAB29